MSITQIADGAAGQISHHIGEAFGQVRQIAVVLVISFDEGDRPQESIVPASKIVVQFIPEKTEIPQHDHLIDRNFA